jgi:hypothetical protein
MHRVMEFAVDQGIGSDNPFARIKTYKLGTYHAWTDDELSGYESRWPIGTPARPRSPTLHRPARKRCSGNPPSRRQGIGHRLDQKTTEK